MKQFIREIPSWKLTPDMISQMENSGFTIVVKQESVEVYADVLEFILPRASESMEKAA